MTTLPKIYCALDTTNLRFIEEIAESVVPLGIGLKLGLTFLGVNGPQGIIEVKDKYPDASIFLDAKLHDIPAQVSGAILSFASLGADYITLHAQGGEEMMREAQEASESTDHAPNLLAVTILTALNDQNIKDTGYNDDVSTVATKLAKLAHKSGVKGIVCSPHEIAQIRSAIGDDMVLMVPGIRPASANIKGDDQKRVMTPKEALDLGANHLVIGRPITGADNPAQAAEDILKEIS